MLQSKKLLFPLLALLLASTLSAVHATEKFHAAAYNTDYTTAQIQWLASHYDVLAIDGNLSPAAFRAVNPDVVLLAYKALVCSSLSDEDWATVNPNESWFVHDPATGLRLQSTDGYPWYLMDPGSSGWRQHFVEFVQKWKNAGFDGFFGDNGFYALINMWMLQIRAEPAVTIGDGRTVRTLNGKGVYGPIGVFTNTSGTGTNYWGSSSEDTITLNSAPGPAGTRVYLFYYANAYRYREPATVDATGAKVTVKNRAEWVYGVYDNANMTGTNYYTMHGYDGFTSSGDRSTISLGVAPGAGRQVWVKYKADTGPADLASTWHDDMMGLYDAIHAGVPGFQVIYNGVVRRGMDEPYPDHADGGMMEQFITVSGDNPLYYDGYARWLEEQQRVEQWNSLHPDKLCMVQSGVSRDASYSTDLKNKWAMFCFASYLLCRGDSTTFNFTKTGYTGLDWYPYWELDYGTPTGPRKAATVSANLLGQGIWQRDFTKCKVVVNPTGGQAFTPTSADVSVTVPLDGAYHILNMDGTISATTVSSVNLAARTGVILFRDGTTPPPTGEKPPAPVVTAPANGSYLATRQTTVKGTETDASAQVTVTVGTQTFGPAAVSSGAWSVAVNLAEGANKLTPTATNSYGSTAGASTTVTVDSQKPAVAISSPANGSQVSGTVTVTATASDPAPSSGLSVQFLLDGVVKATDTASPYTWSWDTTGQGGSHTLTAKAVDKAGNAATATSTVTVAGATGGPAVSFASPTDGSSVSGTVTIQVNATDTATLSKAELYFGSKLVSTLTSPPPYRWSWGVRQTGDLTLKAVVTNSLGQQGSASITVHCPTTGTAPAVPVITAPKTGSKLKTVTCPVSGTEATTGSTVTVLVNGVAQPAVAVTNGAWGTTVTLAQGTNTITAYASNSAGKSATAAAVTVTVDSKAPTVGFASPVNGATIYGDTLIGVGATDALPSSGLGTVKLYIDGSLVSTRTGTPPYRWTWRAIQFGSHTLKAVVTDTMGNEGSSTITVRVG